MRQQRTTLLVFVLLLTAVSMLCTPTKSHGGTIYESDFATGIINTFSPTGTRSVFATGLSNPAGLAFDANGNLFEADEGSGNIYKFTPAGIKSTFATGVGQPYGIAIDKGGNVFVSDVSTRQIYEFTPSGSRKVFEAGLISPEGLAFDAAGNLFVADFNRIDKITTSGKVSHFADAINGAVNLAFSPSGNLFLTTDQQVIFEYTPAGSQSLFGTVPGRSGGITFDAAGNLFVGDRGHVEIGAGTIYEFTPAGIGSTFATGLNDPQALAFAPGPSTSVPEPSSWLLAILGGLFLVFRPLTPRHSTLAKP